MDLTPFEIYVNVATHYLFIQVVLRSSFIFLHTAVACSSFVNIPEGTYPFSVDAALGCFQFVEKAVDKAVPIIPVHDFQWTHAQEWAGWVTSSYTNSFQCVILFTFPSAWSRISIVSHLWPC